MFNRWSWDINKWYTERSFVLMLTWGNTEISEVQWVSFTRYISEALISYVTVILQGEGEVWSIYHNFHHQSFIPCSISIHPYLLPLSEDDYYLCSLDYKPILPSQETCIIIYQFLILSFIFSLNIKIHSMFVKWIIIYQTKICITFNPTSLLLGIYTKTSTTQI